MKKIALIVLFLAVSCPCFALSYFAHEDFGGQWYDADKTYADDSNMCWAASLSNVLAYTGWDSELNADQIFDVYRDNFPNQGNYFESGLSYWFTGSDLMGMSTGGGGYYASESYSNYFVRSTYWATDIMGDIDFWLHEGVGLSVTIDGNQGHALSVYGIEYDDNGYSGLWVVDNNDQIDSLIFLSMHSEASEYYFNNTVWVIDGGTYNGWVLNTANGLMRNESAAPVPEPCTALLVLLGLPYYAARRHNTANRRR